MNQTQDNLLGENRAMGWPDVSLSLASPSRKRFADRLREFRRAALADPVAYRSRCAREERSALTSHVRKVNPLPASLTTSQLLAKAARQAEEINGERYKRELAAAILSNRVDEAFEAVRAGRNPFARYSPLAVEAASEDGGQSSVPAGDASNTLRCSSMTSTREDHEWGSSAHCVLGRKAFDDGDRDLAAKHYVAAECHRAASVPNTPDYVQARAVAACLDCKPSAGFENKA